MTSQPASPARANDIDPRSMIEDFLLDYVHGIDDDDLEAWPGYFTEDGVYQIIPRESYDAGLPVGVMYCEGRGMMIDRVNALRTANIFEPHTYCHVLGRPRLAEQPGGDWTARTNFNVIRTMQDGGTEIYAVGKYVDTLTVADGRPLLKDRRVVLESRRVDVLLVVPL